MVKPWIIVLNNVNLYTAYQQPLNTLACAAHGKRAIGLQFLCQVKRFEIELNQPIQLSSCGAAIPRWFL